MDFSMVLRFLVETFGREKVDFALIGGMALQSAGITRTTRDIDLLILGERSSQIKDIMVKHGYEVINETEDVLNFVGKKFELGRVDFLLAHREYTLEMLKRSEERKVFNDKFTVKVVRPDDLIGLKVQSSSNDPERYYQDMADIKEIIKARYDSIDMDLVREYFRLFKREEELKDILRGIPSA